MFSFNLNPNIKLLQTLPKDPAFDLIIHLPNKESLFVQRTLVSDYSKYFQNFANLKGISEITLSSSLGKSSLLSRVFYLIYGETINFQVDELYDLDHVLDNLDCKKIKEQLKVSLKEEILKTDSLEFFFKVFDHFALRDHKKFCKESLRRLNQLKFFPLISIEIQGECPFSNVLPLLSFLSERSLIKFLCLLLQDEVKRRGGEKYKPEVCSVLEKVVCYYANEILKKPEKGAGLVQDFLFELNPLEKKYFDKDIIIAMQTEIQQLKKTNQSLNNQIQGLRAKESENKAKFINILKRLEKLENGNKHTETEEHEIKEKLERTNSNLHQANKFEEFLLANGENKKNKKQGNQSQKKNPINNNNNSGINKKEEVKENPRKILKDEEIVKVPKQKSPFSLFNNEKELPLLLDVIKKILFSTSVSASPSEKNLGFTKIFEASKHKFSLKKMNEKFLGEVKSQGFLILIRAEIGKTVGVFLSKKPEINVQKDDTKSFLFLLSPFKVFPLKNEHKTKEIIHFNDEKITIGQDLLISNEGNHVFSTFDVNKYYGDEIRNDDMNGILSSLKNFLIHEMILLNISSI